ncbi:molybdopterin-dependent oxidoreductase, partial [Lactococcus formosensis]
EEVLSRAAERLKLDPAEVRDRNFYGEPPRDLAPYGQPIRGNRLPRLHAELMASSDYAPRRTEIEAFNRQARFTRRGIGF